MRLKRLIPFVYSSTIAYLVEIGDYYMRFYYDDVLIAAIKTPYSEADIFKLQYQQVSDVMRIVTGKHHPKKLSRTTAETFSLDDLEFKNGPFLTRNDLIDPKNINPPKMWCSATEVGELGVLECEANVFYDGHEGALFKLIHPVTTTAVSKSGTGNSPSVFIFKEGGYFSTQGTWEGTIKLQRSENNIDWDDFKIYTALTSGARNDAYTIKASDAGENGAYFRINCSHSSCKATLNTWTILREGIVRIKHVAGMKSAICEVVQKLESKNPTARWAEGAWSGYRGYPSTITFFENRCCYAGGISNSERNESDIPAYPVLRDNP